LTNTPLAVAAFDTRIRVPGGGVAFLGSITLAPGWSAYWDIHYPDVPEVGGLWAFQALNPVGGVPGLTIDSSVIEYNSPLAGPGPIGPLFAGPAGGFGAAGGLLGTPLVDITATPEPASLAMLALGGLAVLRRKRR
jgi:hypothetical protein